MADLIFGCTGATAERYSATPTLTFALTITERSGARIHAIALRCQIRIEPHRRRYSADEARRLHDLFGDPSRWADTVKPIQLATVTAMVPTFSDVTEVDLPVPCTYDLEVASARHLPVAEVRALVAKFTQGRTLGFLGEPRVDVLTLNIALDQLSAKSGG